MILNNLEKKNLIFKTSTEENQMTLLNQNKGYVGYLFLKKLKKKLYKESFDFTMENSFSFFILNNKGYCFNIIKNFLELENNPHKFNKEISILDLCHELGLIIPHFCYHYNLSIAGNCRMCLVELNESKKPIVSCALNASSQMHIKTDTFLVRRAREGIMEYLLANHPLDCPVCDQGGECDLQDISLVYGNDRGRFYHFNDFKKSIADFFLTSSVKIILTRCIYCTRCVRFLSELEGNTNVGLLGRGKFSEIGLYDSKLLITTELMSNIIDFCPVGALTGKFFSLSFRSWENIYVETIDLTDSFCAPIRVATDFNKIKRILPKYNSDLNVYWINEKTRNFLDGYLEEQMDLPSYKCLALFKDLDVCEKTSYEEFLKRNIVYINFSWNKVKSLIREFFSSRLTPINFIRCFVGNLVDVFSLLKLKEINLNIGVNNIIDCSEDTLNRINFFLNKDFDSNYIYSINSFKNFKNIFLINLNLRIENPVLNAKLRQKIVWDLDTRVFFFGSSTHAMTYKYIHIGTTTKAFLKIVQGRNYFFNFLAEDGKKKKNLLLYSSELAKTYNSDFFRSAFDYLRKKLFFEIQFLSKNASTINCFELAMDNFLTKSADKTYCDYFINVNEFLLANNNYLKSVNNKLIIYQHYLRDNYFNFADIILPSYSFAETGSQYYINCFGILRVKRRLFNISSEFAKNDYEIISFVYSNIVKIFVNQFFFDAKLDENMQLHFFINLTKIRFKRSKRESKIFSYLPIGLYGVSRKKLFSIDEIKPTKCYYYLSSNKTRNFYKSSYITHFASNINIMSRLKFEFQSNYKL